MVVMMLENMVPAGGGVLLVLVAAPSLYLLCRVEGLVRRGEGGGGGAGGLRGGLPLRHRGVGAAGGSSVRIHCIEIHRLPMWDHGMVKH